MCVKNMEFIATEEIMGDFAANGVLGLAPVEDGIIDMMYQEGFIERRIVGLNYENPADTD
jgi:hypothetical protein